MAENKEKQAAESIEKSAESRKNPTEQEMLSKMGIPLLEWYQREKRQLPWRESVDQASDNQRAYHVWVSEIMLQQTRVEAVNPYYARFLEALPGIRDLAWVQEEQLLKLWEGLGYYNRVRNMQKAARVLMEQYGGEFPKEYESVLALPGIGSYTAGAICSIAFGVPVPAVDGNVLRVISRFLAKDWDIGKQSVKGAVEQLLTKAMPTMYPGDFNQALMELGATVCVPNGIARCDDCPIGKLCLARIQDQVMQLPIKAPKKPRRIEEKTVLLLKGQDAVGLSKRKKTGLLAGLWEFPNLEGSLSQEEVLERVKNAGISAIRIEKLPSAKHIFSHVEWHMTAYRVQLDETEMSLLDKKKDKNKSSSAQNRFNRKSIFIGETPLVFVEETTIGREYAIPSAFAAYKPYVITK